jgi:ComF family protein
MAIMVRGMPVFREWVRGLSNVIFPPTCVHCRALVPTDGPFRHLCPKCIPLIHFVRPPHCCTCGHPYFGVVEGERMCPHCVWISPAFQEGRTAVLLKGPARALVHELKYHRGLHVLTDIEQVFQLAPHAVDLARDAILVPVPLHPRKQRERSFNQSELLAQVVARVAAGATRVELLLQRVIDTVSQTHHDRETRKSNLKNAFALADHAIINPHQHYLLVDDVFTTGSTLNGCAQVLRRAGALKLDVLTFGHG